mgnify:CR=1 FL=1
MIVDNCENASKSDIHCDLIEQFWINVNNFLCTTNDILVCTCITCIYHVAILNNKRLLLFSFGQTIRPCTVHTCYAGWLHRQRWGVKGISITTKSILGFFFPSYQIIQQLSISLPPGLDNPESYVSASQMLSDFSMRIDLVKVGVVMRILVLTWIRVGNSCVRVSWSCIKLTWFRLGQLFIFLQILNIPS